MLHIRVIVKGLAWLIVLHVQKKIAADQAFLFAQQSDLLLNLNLSMFKSCVKQTKTLGIRNVFCLHQRIFCLLKEFSTIISTKEWFCFSNDLSNFNSPNLVQFLRYVDCKYSQNVIMILTSWIVN